MTQLRRLLMTGATGFIGRRTLPGLVERGFELHCVSRRPDPQISGVQWHRGDLGAHAEVTRIIDQVRPTHLLHLAWETAHGSYYTTPDNVRCLRDSLHLVDGFIRAGGRRLVCAGSAAEYDLSATADLNEETSALRPNGLYGECKGALLRILDRYAAQSGISHAWGRIFFCYGPGEDPSRTVPTLISELLKGASVPFQEGRAIRDYVYVDDVAEAFVRLADSDIGGPVNLGSGTGVTLRELAERIASAAGRPGGVRIGAAPTPEYEPPRVVADVRKARSELGWRAGWSLDDGIRETVEWWRARLTVGRPFTDRGSAEP